MPIRQVLLQQRSRPSSCGVAQVARTAVNQVGDDGIDPALRRRWTATASGVGQPFGYRTRPRDEAGQPLMNGLTREGQSCGNRGCVFAAPPPQERLNTP